MKRYVMEMVGTLFLVVTIGITAGSALAVGFMLMALMYMGYQVSGAHYNPAITLATWVHKKSEHADILFYILAQCVGTLIALMLIYAITDAMRLPEPLEGLPLWIGFGFEVALTYLFTFVYLIVNASATFKGNQVYGLVVGFAFIAAALMAASVNPAVGLGTMLFNIVREWNTLSNSDLIYMMGKDVVRSIVGPLCGGALAGLAYNYFYGHDGRSHS